MEIKTMVESLKSKLVSKTSRIFVLIFGILLLGGILLSLPWSLANFIGTIFCLFGVTAVAVLSIGQLLFWVEEGK